MRSVSAFKTLTIRRGRLTSERYCRPATLQVGDNAICEFLRIGLDNEGQCGVSTTHHDRSPLECGLETNGFQGARQVIPDDGLCLRSPIVMRVHLIIADDRFCAGFSRAQRRAAPWLWR